MTHIFAGLRYFQVENWTKFYIDLLPTWLLALVATGVLVILSGVNFFAAGGVLANLGGLTAALTGFYVAALTAAATFENKDLDVQIANGPPKLNGEALTRREWVTTIFGYLSVSAMGFTLFAAAGVPLSSALKSAMVSRAQIPEDMIVWVSIGLKFLALLWISHIFVVTLLGTSYLMGRLSEKTPRVKTTKADV
jgi:hypothetical protein